MKITVKPEISKLQIRWDGKGFRLVVKDRNRRVIPFPAKGAVIQKFECNVSFPKKGAPKFNGMQIDWTLDWNQVLEMLE